MAKSDYLSQNDEIFGTQLLTFKAAIAGYATTLGLIPAQVTAQAADADYFNFLVTCQSIKQDDAKQWTAWRNLARGGTTGGVTPPITTPLPTAVPPVDPGIEPRFRTLVKQVKGSANYNEAIGQALGIEGSQQTGPDLMTVQPVLDAHITGNQVLVNWGWGGNADFLDACEIEVDRADSKGFVLLTFDTTPNYTDTAPFPTTAAKWTYRAIYRVSDSRVGQWSAPVSVMVG